MEMLLTEFHSKSANLKVVLLRAVEPIKQFNQPISQGLYSMLSLTACLVLICKIALISALPHQNRL